MTRQTITIDCETLPTAVSFEKQTRWETEEEYKKTALDGNFGRLLCIGYTREFAGGGKLEHGCFGWNTETQSFETDEAVLLTEFWEMMRSFDRFKDTIIGHNIIDFDLPFIIKRSIINGIRPTVDFCFARYQRQPIFDTMREWIAGFRQQKEFRRLDPSLLEKMIQALYLLQNLKKQGLDFVFKGGTSLILLLENTNRFSIDVDIILNKKYENESTRKEIEQLLDKIKADSSFTNWTLDEKRSYQEGIPKAHYKLEYQPK